MGTMKEDVEEKLFMGDRGYGDDPSTFDEAMSDINFKK